MKLDQVKSLFTLAGIDILRSEALIDGYGYSPDDPRFYEQPPRCAWWFVKTKVGWIKIGWRKRVTEIEWSDTPIRKLVTMDAVTIGETIVHSWSDESTIRYLKSLAEEIK